MVEADDAGTADRLSVEGLKMRATANIEGVQWGKLLVNLNNALNALADLPLHQQLARRGWRRLFADQMAEGLRALAAEGIVPVSSTPVPANWTPHLLRLPDAVFNAVLGRTMKIDPEARSSMWEDLQRGRLTEIGYLQGVITEIADRRGLQVPLTRHVVALIRSAEQAGKARRDCRWNRSGLDRGRLEMATMGDDFSGPCREQRHETILRKGRRTCGARRCGVRNAADAAPPTATPSPGYDARLQEQRAARTVYRAGRACFQAGDDAPRQADQRTLMMPSRLRFCSSRATAKTC